MHPGNETSLQPTAGLAATQLPKENASFVLCSPLSKHSLDELPEIVSDPYHPPPPGREERHQGVDFSYYRRGERVSILGMGVQSVLSGQVAAALVDKFPYGNTVIVETSYQDLPEELTRQFKIEKDESLYLLYAHLGEAPLVELGEMVNACQPLGLVGKSGNAGIPHLHLETRIGPAGEIFTSMLFYSTQATPEEMANYIKWRTSGIFRHFDPMDLLAFGHK
jgi:murein DD-endopeptidase MepM/ murein hydrolase activator NlpD